METRRKINLSKINLSKSVSFLVFQVDDVDKEHYAMALYIDGSALDHGKLYI